ncbi:MAG: RNA-binding protein [Pseudorhodoplanes sp.]|jgi:predicted RNA-binding protein YlxR (DUF448 family)|nr:RNA-binding protein [Pseudorhodoplanes sp.]
MLARVIESELDSGPRERGTERFCVVTRAVKPIDDLIRFVVAPDGSVVPDLKHRLPGRGVWVTATRDALTEAVRKKAFARGFKAEIRTTAELAGFTENLLVKSALDALAMAGKAGCVITGFSKVEAAIADHEIAAVLHGKDASADGIRKIEAALHRHGVENAGEIVVIDEFTTDDLDLALGRSNVVHAALLAGPAGKAFLTRLQRLRRFRAGDPGKPGRGETRHEGARRLDSE